MTVIYLHGFASSAQSSKAMFFAARLRERGIDLLTPDFNEPEFSTLTISRMIERVAALMDGHGAPVTLIGSSLGGFVAIQTALKHPDRVGRLVLLAPALDLSSGPPGDRSLSEWKRTNRLDVFHYAYGRVMPLEYALYADAQSYDSLNASLEIPIQIFQGRRDTAVAPSTVEGWACGKSNVELHMLDDDHQLSGSLNYIWSRVEGAFTSKSRRSEPESPPV
jgi:pimeloyl-ACP methyl ester carboxylesterase